MFGLALRGFAEIIGNRGDKRVGRLAF